MFKIIRKADIVLFFILIALGVALSIPSFALDNNGSASDNAGSNAGTNNSARSSVEISVAGKYRASYPLDQDKEIYIVQRDGTADFLDPDSEFFDPESASHVNKVIIKDSTVQMDEASCHNQVCVKQGAINRPGQSIICLPNRVVVRITNGANSSDTNGPIEGGDVDVISG